ncbi:alpha/beta hydrolase [Krasilnikoviella flava]|uniref:Lysophospholipase, alpha-beta hydrolase superfamily n=1 Tax=Krasilnikoviella flava TaxID=526729 RepID=A0A1T5KE16_9MICO|nr:alpha/beta hydrolase [Krasilnikoviella flava]SKC61870.1 Lysophospholipase, alpha-beta hydrolase superfamily [Krasilnikoviella flava]
MDDETGTAWQPDVLPGFEQLTLPLEQDFEGDVVATLVRRAPEPDGGDTVPDAGVDVLYVHGWVDYFFQTHLAAFWERQGARFYALDLRKYGRSLREHQTPGFVTALATYDEDVEAALAVLGHGPRPSSDRRLVLMGHSTGGLVLSLWVSHRPGRADALVLNSPWLEFQTRSVGRWVLEPGLRAQAALAPRSHLVNVDLGYYVRSVSHRYDGAWEIDPAWRPDMGWRATPAWLSAIFQGQERVSRGLGIDIPVLVLLSARSTTPVRWSPEMMTTDSVLEVGGVARRVPALGSLVTLVRVDGALHDVTLSAPAVRDVVWREISRWAGAYVPGSPPVAEPEPSGAAAWWRRTFGRGRPSRRGVTAPAPAPAPRPARGRSVNPTV